MDFTTNNLPGGSVGLWTANTLILLWKIAVLSKLGHSRATFDCEAEQSAYEAPRMLFRNLRKTLLTHNVWYYWCFF